MSEVQKRTVLDALDLSRFFEVASVEVPLVGAIGKEPACLYAVEKLVWQDGGELVPVPEGQVLPPGARTNPFNPTQAFFPVFSRDPAGGGQVVKVFVDRDKAEEHCRRLDQKARAGVNPFRCGTRMTDWSSLDADRLHDWVLDLGLTPPPRKAKGTEAARWRPWWDANVTQMTRLQRDRMWEALDRVRFYQVTELRPDKPGAE